MPKIVAIGQTVVEMGLPRFWIFQDGGSHRLGFLNFKFLTTGTVKKDELRHCAKFCRNRSNHRGDMSVFDLLRWRPPPYWRSELSTFKRSERSRGSNCISVPHFVKIGQTAAEIWLFFDFSRRQPPPSWIFEISISNVLELYMQYELWKRMVLLDMFSMPCSRLHSKPDYSTMPLLGQVTVLLPTATVWSRFCGAAIPTCRWDTLNVCWTIIDMCFTRCCLQGLNTATTSDADDTTTNSLQNPVHWTLTILVYVCYRKTVIDTFIPYHE